MAPKNARNGHDMPLKTPFSKRQNRFHPVAGYEK